MSGGVVAGCWGKSRWVESLVCLGCLCDLGFVGVGYLVVVGLLVRGTSAGVGGGLLGGVVEILGRSQ